MKSRSAATSEQTAPNANLRRCATAITVTSTSACTSATKTIAAQKLRKLICSPAHIQLHALEDAESVQLAISMVVNALATGALEPKRATPLLYGLQLASINLSRLASQPKPYDIVRDVTTTPDGVDRSCHYNSISLDSAVTPAPMERETTPIRTLALPPGQHYEDNLPD